MNIVNAFSNGASQTTIEGDPTGLRPLYLFESKVKNAVYYSHEINELLDISIHTNELNISASGLSYLLQNGVIPLPQSIYTNIYILGIGDIAVIGEKNGQIEIVFQRRFPYYSERRGNNSPVKLDELLQSISNATEKQLRAGKPSYLFHSAGKDSNTIALALKKYGNIDQLTLVTHKSQGPKDESEISKAIAKQLGLKHEVLSEPSNLNDGNISKLKKYFQSCPFPSVDNVSIVYPLYSMDNDDFIDCNLIDGMGNDVYIGHIPGKSEYEKQQRYSRLSKLRNIVRQGASASKLQFATNTRAEWCGLLGFSYGDSRKIYPKSIDCSSYWRNWDQAHAGIDYFDLRAATRGIHLDQEVFIRKVRNFANHTKSNLILPWADQSVVDYIFSIAPDLLFDKVALRNKIVLRELLKGELSLDSDKLGKLGYEFDFFKLLQSNREYVESEVLNCKYWDKEQSAKLLDDLRIKSKLHDSRALIHQVLYQRLFLISAWINNNRFTNP